MPTLGIIGGSGLYDLPGLTSLREVRLKTPFGDPSDAFVVGDLGATHLVFLPRHGRGHRWSPTEINVRANLWGLKKLGAERVLSISAVGSMREAIAPGDLVVVDQFIDRTRQRPSSFFGGGIVGHVSFADPVCADLAGVVRRAAESAAPGDPARIHPRGTYLCIEGPQFSTRAESTLYRQWGVDVIGMTNLPEAPLAREAELCYATLALSTDYDCWHESEDEVSVPAVVAVLERNVALARRVIVEVARTLPRDRTCPCAHALKHAIMTRPDRVPAARRRALDLFVGKYLPAARAAATRRIAARRGRRPRRSR